MSSRVTFPLPTHIKNIHFSEIDLSADSDLELNDDVADLSEVEDVKVDEEELNDLDKLINSTKEKPAGRQTIIRWDLSVKFQRT